MLEFWRVKHRKFKWDDLYNVQALINMVAEEEGDPYFYNLEWLYFVLNQPDIKPQKNCFVATVYGGRIVGYSRIEATEDPTRWKAFAGTHPNMQNIGVGRALITVNDLNLMMIHPDDEPLTVIRQSQADHYPSADLLAHAGYHQSDVDAENTIIWEKHLRCVGVNAGHKTLHHNKE